MNQYAQVLQTEVSWVLIPHEWIISFPVFKKQCKMGFEYIWRASSFVMLFFFHIVFGLEEIKLALGVVTAYTNICYSIVR